VHPETSLQIRSGFHDLVNEKRKEEHTFRCFQERNWAGPMGGTMPSVAARTETSL
jgi:hypothetical protein